MQAYASPLYLERLGKPEHPNDLNDGHRCVGYLQAPSGRIMQMTFCRGEEEIEIDPNYIVSVNDARSYLDAAIAGVGVAQIPRFMAQKPMQEGKLVPILTEWTCESFPLYIVYPQTRHLSNKVRVVVDWLAKRVQTLKVEENRQLMREAS